MRVLIACEFSGVVRDAFIKEGFDAISCDLLPTERKGPHFQEDIAYVIDYDDWWDLVIAFPPCTYVCNSGVRWLWEQPERMEKMVDGARFIRFFLEEISDVTNHVAVENPIPHKYALSIIGRKYDQIIQPWQFGHGETKATCLWLKNLPLLAPTKVVKGREQRIWKMSPSKNRGKERSKTYEGIAEAMAKQWGTFIRNQAP